MRTAIEFIPDGEYQETLFREAERLDPAIEHLGTWHSHHCNGLQELSSGDIEGYFRTVNKAHYRPQLFFASLVKYIPADSEDQAWIDHFLFVRGIERYYMATRHIRFIDWPTTFAAQTGHSQRDREAMGLTSIKDQPKVLYGRSYSFWYETAEGRSVLAEDKRFFGEQFSNNVIATRRNSQITLTGQVEDKGISVTYPRNAGDQEVSITVLQRGAPILHMHCELSHRRISYRAALSAVQSF